jgi:hypothetical protein
MAIWPIHGAYGVGYAAAQIKAISSIPNHLFRLQTDLQMLHRALHWKGEMTWPIVYIPWEKMENMEKLMFSSW